MGSKGRSTKHCIAGDVTPDLCLAGPGFKSRTRERLPWRKVSRASTLYRHWTSSQATTAPLHILTDHATVRRHFGDSVIWYSVNQTVPWTRSWTPTRVLNDGPTTVKMESRSTNDSFHPRVSSVPTGLLQSVHSCRLQPVARESSQFWPRGNT